VHNAVALTEEAKAGFEKELDAKREKLIMLEQRIARETEELKAPQGTSAEV